MKLRTLEELPALLKGKKTVLADGCFDILSVEQVRYLENARQLGDALVVAIHNDRSGPPAEQTILSQSERAALVSGLRCVDHVVMLGEGNVNGMLDTIRPAIHAKGSDAEADSRNNVIRRIQESYGRES